MQRITLFAVVLAALALPARAESPTGWQSGSGPAATYTLLSAVSDSVAYAGGSDGVLVRTSDGGLSWTAVTAPSTAALASIGSADPQVVFALDTRGQVERSTDAGASWSPLAPAGGIHPLTLEALPGSRLLLAGRRSLLRSTDNGDTFASVTPKLARDDSFRSIDRAGSALFVSGPRTLLASTDSGRTWRHLRLPRLARGDGVFTADFVGPRTGFVLTNFRRLLRTRDAGHHWSELLGTGGAGQDLAFADARRGWLAAPGFAGRLDGVVLQTTDGGATWRPQVVTSRFLSHVAATPSRAYAVGDEGTKLFASDAAGESGPPITVGFRPAPRHARRGQVVRVRGRLSRRLGGVGVAVSMRSAGRWIARYVRTDRAGVFSAKFKLQRSAAFVVQVPTGDGHGSAATRPVTVHVAR